MRQPLLAPKSATGHAVTRIALLGALCGLAVATAPARAQDMAPDEKFLDSIMTGIGLERPGSKPNIDYRERSPLVIPPSTTSLPPPETAAVKDPNWPVDPEVRQANALKAMQKDDGLTSSQRMDVSARPLPIDEIEKGRAYGKGRADGKTVDDKGLPLRPNQLGYVGGLWDQVFGNGKKEETAKFTGEPSRTSLIEPPTGYQTPSPNQPYTAGKGKAYVPHITDPYYDHGMNIGK